MTARITVCPNTRLALVPAGGRSVYRLAKPSYGVLNPPTRSPSSSDDRSGWNRFDLPGEQTVYCASSAEGAYGELLGALKISGPYRADEYLDDPGEDDLYALIAQDWAELGARPPGVIDINWLYAHRMYTVVMPQAGWFVEIEHARTITYLGAHIPLSLWERGIAEITVAQTRGADRYVTTELAGALAAAPLADQARALGVHYYSKHGTEWSCWAVWLREDVAGALSPDAGQAIAPPARNAALAAVLDTYNLTAH
ncbi:hypothetical protein [Dietzia psychralcaliphila]|uniref:hypothetical protein n=1 Tax=Dietzia psychralcaliphila TaxID=139021 RepID=UPI001C1DEC26|nr:hypothetical protein [Dietzia psychralcaliphila]